MERSKQCTICIDTVPRYTGQFTVYKISMTAHDLSLETAEGQYKEQKA